MFAIITPGPDPRRDRRAHEVQRLVRVHHHLVPRRCTARSPTWCGASEGWIFKAGAIDFAGGLVVHMSSGFSALVRGAHARQAPRLRQGADAAAQPAALHGRRRAPLDRLVRLQRRQRAQREPARDPRLPEHQHGGLDGGRRVGAASRCCIAASRRRSAAPPRRSPVWSRSRRPAATSRRWARSGSAPASRWSRTSPARS